MRLRHLLLVLALAITLQAKAQVGIYGTFSASHVGNIKPPFPYTDTYGFWALGGGIGIYDDFLHAGPIHLGADLRGSLLNSKGHKLNSGLAGARLSFRSRGIPLKPYVQASIGVGSTNYGGGNLMTKDLQYEVFGGLDVSFLPHVDWRLIEVGAGGLVDTGNNHVGSNFPMQTVSTGLVLRLP